VVCDGDRAVAVEEFFGGIDTECGVEGGVEVRYGDGAIDNFAAEVIGSADDESGFESAAEDGDGEGSALVTASAPAVKFGWASEFGTDGDECGIEEIALLEVIEESGEGLVEFLNEDVLIFLTVVMGIPAGAIYEVKVEGDFDETDTVLYESSGEQAALAEFTAVGISGVGGFVLQVEYGSEAGAGEGFAAESCADVVFDGAEAAVAAAKVVAHGVEQSLAAIES
jgi:hypothetical protein